MDLQELDVLLDEARLPEATVSLCLRGDLQAQWEALETELVQRRQVAQTLADAAVTGLVERIRELEDIMRRATVTFTLRAMDRPTWAEFRGAHPPREKDRTDHVMGVNNATFFPAIVRHSIVDPVLSDEQFDKLLSKISDAQFDKLANAAWDLNRRDVSVPFSPTASPTAPSSGETSEVPSG